MSEHERASAFLPEKWIKTNPIIADMAALQEVFWENDRRVFASIGLRQCSLSLSDVYDAEARLLRFSPLLMRAFPETVQSGGIIESELKELQTYKAAMRNSYSGFTGKLFVKLDSHLPISGSIKARGGIYEVLAHAERLALDSGNLKITDDYSCLLDEPFRTLFSSHHLVAASTGNLGLSIGIMAAALGFQTTVHMSSDARKWKKDLLRQLGVEVVEHEGDFSAAVDAGRASVKAGGHFVDDENSRDLFLGYAVAALRLRDQLNDREIAVDREHPLFVYLPCGVGGGPGGVTFGLKHLFGDHVHCFFAEPVQAPAMTLGLVTGLHDDVSVQDFGIKNQTAADGLAVGRPSRFVGREIGPLVDGCYTVDDERLFERLHLLADTENIRLEPSALAGFYGPEVLFNSDQAEAYRLQFSEKQFCQSTHIAWATGGGMVPAEIWWEYYEKGAS